MTIFRNFLLSFVASLLLVSCTGVPKGIVPITDFNSDQYLGTWYEIARYDHRFERGLSQVSATYSMREDGGIRVLNRGYKDKTSEWDTAEGKAYFVGDDTTGHLKVSFFGPFYASYVIFDLDAPDYTRSYVTGNTTDYLWFLSRTPTVSEAEKDAFITKVTEKGFDPEKLIWVAQDKQPRP